MADSVSGPGGDGTQSVVLLVEDDPDVAAYTTMVLQHLGGARVLGSASADAALAVLAAEHVDLVVTDIELLPGADGLALTAIIRERFPLMPVVVLSGHATFDHAVVAMRAGASEFLAKPVDPQRLTEVVTRLVEEHRRRVAAESVSVLAISAHPDDAEIGVGATLAKHVRQGHAVTMLTLSGGEIGGAPGARAVELAESAAVIGAKLDHRSLPDTEISDGRTTVALIEEVVRATRPSVIYLHSAEDTHQDHRAVHRAGLAAVRGVPTVLCYQSPSATVAFRPGQFTDVTGFLDVKLAALACHRSQAATWYMDPELVVATARFWGRFGRIRHAEPLEVVRDVPRSTAVAAPGASTPRAPSPVGGHPPVVDGQR